LDWREGPGNLSQKGAKTCIHCDVTYREPQIRNEKKIFFSLKWKTYRVRGGFEQLSSSIDWQVMELQTLVKKLAVVGLKG